MTEEPCDHSRPGRDAQKTVLAVAAAVLANDPQQVADAAEAAPCPACALIASVQFTFAAASEVFNVAVERASGKPQSAAMTPALHGAMTAIVAQARRQLDAQAN